jgi:uncharacterized protein YggE
MKFRALTIAAVAMAALTVPVVAHDEGVLTNAITVSGTGRVRVAPDRVMFNAGVETVAPSVDAAVRENNAKTQRVVDALKAAGAKAEEIQTSNFSIYPQYEYHEGGRKPTITGYQVNNTITVTRSKVDDAGRLLQAAITAGVNNASGLNFFVSDPARGRDEGLRKAFADARSKAQTLAAAAGRTLGAAIAIGEASASYPVPTPMVGRAMAMEASKVGNEVPVQAGQEEVVFQINATFALQ